MRLKSIFVLAIIVMASIHGNGQELNNLLVDFRVADSDSNTLFDSEVELRAADGSLVKLFHGPNEGKRYSISFSFDTSVNLLIKASGYNTKVFKVDTRNVPLEAQEWGFENGGFLFKLDTASNQCQSDTIGSLFYNPHIEMFEFEKF